jgi:threonine dehydrogenase-like Zn-dependent dehydrogenase
MIEPLAVGVHSVAKLGGFQSGQNIVVFGAGPVGLLCMAVAKALGAKKIFAVDINKERLDFAKGYAATDIYQPVRPLHAFECQACPLAERTLYHPHYYSPLRTPTNLAQITLNVQPWR